MAQILRQSTAVDILIGPFVDSTDGDTEETALTIEDSDVRISKNGQNIIDKNDVTSAAHDEKGMYNCELDATDTDTIGQLTVYIHVTGALAVRHDYQIIEEDAYDFLYVSGAAPDTQVADIKAETALIVADTNELQGDWADGGRLDLLLDALQTDLDNATDGLGALKALIDTVNTDLANGTDGLGALKALIDTVNTDLANGTDGLGALKTLLDAIPTTAMRGTDNAALASEVTSARMGALTDWINGGRLDLLLDAIKVPTDKMVFTKANELDVNTKSINDAEVVGDGNATPWDGV